ncbi:MAG: hypothetical protein M3Y13_06550 [Armatimonadota bacterium]|nr:hypothetical protein [Armatimonadota bacterium]
MSYQENAHFRATTGAKEAFGTTPQKALAALMPHLSGDAFSPIIIWSFNQGDAYFTNGQQARMQELKGRRDTLTAEEYAELEGLIEAALDATIARTKSLMPAKE